MDLPIRAYPFVRDAVVGDIFEVFYDSSYGGLYASLSPSAGLCMLPKVKEDGSWGHPRPIFQAMISMFQGKRLKPEERPQIRFDTSYALFFNTLVTLDQIVKLVGRMTPEDQARIEIIAVRETLLFGKCSEKLLEALVPFENLKIVRLVSEIPSAEMGKECLGPRQVPVDMVQFYSPVFTPSREANPYFANDAMRQIDKKLKELWDWN